ncbi:hypothetical protein NMY22_g6623 [Coprinellus aureogranulatus]|nr:hypothetical protein NMY22_g6623 [Coprinellus aureogranulatus]
MLNQARLPMMFWGAAVLYYTDILNATPSSALSSTTSYEVWHKTKPDLSMHRVFGCRVYVHIQRKDRKNLQSHTEACIFVGFEPGYKGWKCYNPATKKIVISRDVIFAENTFPGLSTVGDPQAYKPIGIRDIWPDTDLEPEQAPLPPPHTPIAPIAPNAPLIPPPPPHFHNSDESDESDDDGDDGGQAAPKTPERPTKTEPTKPTAGKQPFQPATPPIPTGKDNSSNHRNDHQTSQGLAFPEVPRPTVPPAPTKKRTKPPPPPPHDTLPRAAKAPKPAPLVAQSSRPIREAATSVPDYQLKSGKGRWGTAPVPRHQGGEQVTDRGGEKGNNQPTDSDEDDDESDTSDTSDDSDHPEPITQESINDEDDEPVDLENALRATPIVNSLYDVYDIHLGEILPFEHALEMCYAMAVDKHQQAFGAATRPEDAPRTFREAMSSASADHWIDATQAEMDAHETNGTWELVELLEGQKVIGSHARLVAQGYSQMPGVDYDQTFSPAVRLAALRVVLAQVAAQDGTSSLPTCQNAYLNGVMEDKYEVYMGQAEGYEVKGPNGKKWVCCLKKGIYGLKQSGRLWNQKLAAELERLGFTQIKSDPSIYVWETDGIRIILQVFVDNITIASASPEKIQWVKDALGKVFKLKDLGPTSFLLGIKINYDRENRVLQLSQRQYILDILKCFNMSECSPVKTPMDPGSGPQLRRYVPDPDNPVDMTGVPYMSGVRAAMYLAIATRPDLIYAVAKLAQYNSNPGTIDLKLTYRGCEMTSELFHAYSGADHAGCLDTRRSTSGSLIKMGSGAVSWSSKKQTTVADSSTEAEYVSVSAAGREIFWMRTLLKEIGVEVKGPSPLMVDNQLALRILNNPEHHGQMKHIDVKYHWVRDAVKQGKIEVHFLPTQDMIADIFTKPLPRPAIEQHRRALGLE